MGSGSTGRGAVLEGFNFIGCELSDEYVAIARARIDAVTDDEHMSSEFYEASDIFG
jgi:DNA modification methylase